MDDADTVELSEVAVVREDAADTVLPHERDDVSIGHEVPGGADFGTGVGEALDEPCGFRSRPNVRLTHEFSDVPQRFGESQRIRVKPWICHYSHIPRDHRPKQVCQLIRRAQICQGSNGARVER